VPGLADSLGEEVSVDAIIIDFSNAFDLVPRNRLFTKLVASGVDSRVVFWVMEYLVGLTQRVRVGQQQTKQSQSNLRCAAGERFGPVLFLVHINDIWRNIDACIRLFADDFIIYRKITNKNYIQNLQKDLHTLGGMGGRRWDENKSLLK
jgi:hypothetical protein